MTASMALNSLMRRASGLRKGTGLGPFCDSSLRQQQPLRHDDHATPHSRRLAEMKRSFSSNSIRRFRRSARSSALRSAFCQFRRVFFPAFSSSRSSAARLSQKLISFLRRASPPARRLRHLRQASCLHFGHMALGEIDRGEADRRLFQIVCAASPRAACRKPARSPRPLLDAGSGGGRSPHLQPFPVLSIEANCSFSEMMWGLPVLVGRPSGRCVFQQEDGGQVWPGRFHRP